MVELELAGLHSDGEHLTLTGPEGREYRLPVNDALRAAVRRDRPHLEQIRAAEHPLRPKEIQARVRAGATAESVAQAAGLPIDYVRRYEGPVVAERQWVVSQARGFPIGRGEDSPLLGDLVVDRLATRDVPIDELSWDAIRADGGDWELLVMFRVGDRDRCARWQVDMASRSLHALDDEGRWLSETEVSPASARRHLVPLRLYDVEADGDLQPALEAVDADLGQPERESMLPGMDDAEQPDADDGTVPGPEQEPATSTEDLLAELRANRGQRQDVVVEPDVDSDDADTELPPAAHPPASRPQDAGDAHVLPLPEGYRPSRRHPAGSQLPQPRQQSTASSGADAPEGNEGGDRPVGGRSTQRGTGSKRRGSSEQRGTGTDPATGSSDVPAPNAEDTSGGENSATRPSGARGKQSRSRVRSARSGRATMPSWDEIVFGAKPD